MLLKKAIFFALTMMLGCTADYGVTTQLVETEEILPTEVQVDSFIQPSKPEQVDVLILLDTSCSMSDNYSQVSDGVRLLRNDLDSVTNDYNIAFINTSLYSPYFAGTYDRDTPTIDFVIAPWTLAGDIVEAGFLALYNFYTSMPEAAEFFRESADKLFVFISDENEQSDIPVRVFDEWLQTTFQDVQIDVVSIVSTPDSECEYVDYTSVIGYRYINLAARYGKDGLDICSDWEKWLSNSTFLVGPVDYIDLTYTPIEESIKIYVDNVEIKKKKWKYKKKRNIVKLSYTPPEGSLIEAAYVINSE
jgi:hypothetical protein